MAKHKKKRAKYVSKGLFSNMSKSNIRLCREGRSEGDKIENKLNAWRAGKRGFVTIANPNPAETDRRFIKVTFNQFFGQGRDYKTIRAGTKPNEDKNRIEF